MTTRRDFLIGTGSAAAAATMPLAAVSEAVGGVSASPTAIMPAWAVGRPGEWDWRAIEARTEQEAIEIWAREEYYDADSPKTVKAIRQETWDGKGVIEGDANWFKSGYGTHCNRCGYETDSDFSGGYYLPNEGAVCIECMELPDFKIADPERYAEMVEELLDEEYGYMG